MKIYHYALALTVLSLTNSCQKNEVENSNKSSALATIELLSHTQGKFTVAEQVTVEEMKQDFAIGGKSFTIKSRWDDAEMTRETLNTNTKESHAVELKWSVEDKQETLWLFPAGSEENASPQLVGTSVQPKLLPPGARIALLDETRQSPLRAVQVEWKNKRYDVPEIGQEIFPGWKLVATRLFKHALRNDDGGVVETKDSSFSNRAVELTLESKEGSKERHICFVDHPKLTAGIHPTILPVTRLAGEQASLARIKVCPVLKAPVEKSLLVLSPNNEGEGLTAWAWSKGAKAPVSQSIDKFPITLALGEHKVEVSQHWRNALRQIKWQQREGASDQKKQPAILIESGGHFHAQQFVLIKGTVTPCRVMEDMVILRYK